MREKRGPTSEREFPIPVLHLPEYLNDWKYRIVNASVIVALLGLVFVIGGVAFWYLELVQTADSAQHALFELVVHVLFGGIILILGIHIERSELLPEERFAVMVWCYGGFTLMFALSVWGHIDSILGGELTTAFASDFVVFTSLGGAFGVIAGVNWGRATKNKILAEENEEQRETLALLTRLVSHDIRNDMAIIEGYADLLTEHVDEEGASHVETIQGRIDETVQLLEDASALVKSIDEDREFERINLSNVLDQQVTTIAEDHPNVDLDIEIPTGIVIDADSLIHQLFSNLLQNAVFHNNPENLTIHVTAEEVDDSVEITISDNGTGIPPGVRESCFELGEQGPESNGDGIGLYLVSRLADIYGGSVELDESPSGGARFSVSLPTSTPADAH